LKLFGKALIFMPRPRCWRHSAFGYVYPWVSEWVCASQRHCEHHISEGNFT